MVKTKELKKGDKFNKLTVIKLDHKKEYINPNTKYKRMQEYYLCKCECGNECIISKEGLKYKHTKSCGCLKKENLKKIQKKYCFKHGYSNNTIYNSYKSMKNRCYNKKDHAYKNYGGRGITICQEWLDKENGFMSFYNWSINNKHKDNLTIDRINNNGNYEPSNCRWATNKEQNRNQRKNRMITYKNETVCLSELAERFNINKRVVYDRLKYNWSIEKALNTEVKKYAKNNNSDNKSF